MSVNSKMTAIANAIRAKTGGSGTLTLDQMATAIANIETNSSTNSKSVSEVTCIITTSTGKYLGDINNDGVVDGTDEELAGELVANGEYDEAADLDGDGMVTTADLRQLSNLIAGLEEGQIIAKIIVSYTDGTSNIHYVTTDAPESKNGIDTSDATATAPNILAPYTAYVNGKKIAGTMRDNTGSSAYIIEESDGIVKSGTEVSLQLYLPLSGYYNESTKLRYKQEDLIDDIGLSAEKIVAGNTILGIAGTGGTGEGNSDSTLDGITYACNSLTQSEDSTSPITFTHNLGRTPTSVSIWAKPDVATGLGFVSGVYISSLSISGVNCFNSGATGVNAIVGNYISVNASSFTVTPPDNSKWVNGWTYYWFAI